MPPPYPAPPGFFPPPRGFFPPPQPVSPAGVPLADFGTRLLAYLIDTVLLGIVIAAVALPAFFLAAGYFFSRVDPNTPDNDPSGFFTAAVPLFGVELGIFAFAQLVYYLYTVELQFRSGQTLGKRIMKIRVVPLDPNLRLTRLTAFKRYAAGYLPGGLVAAYLLVDGLWQTWDRPYQQTLHDKAAQTVVVKVSA